MPERVLEVLRELERADSEIGTALAELDRLAHEVNAVRTAASRLLDFEGRLPAVRNAATRDLSLAHYQVSRASVGVSEAEKAVRTASKDRAREAERFAVRARDSLAAAKRRYARARAAYVELEAEVETAQAESRTVRVKSRRLAKELGGRRRLANAVGTKPGRGLPDIIEWGEAARAALFVARGQLAAERDGVIRQANELGAAALGEPLTASGTGALARRVEHGLAEGD